MMTIEVEQGIKDRLSVGIGPYYFADRNKIRLREIHFEEEVYAEGFVVGFWGMRVYAKHYWDPFKRDAYEIGMDDGASFRAIVG